MPSAFVFAIFVLLLISLSARRSPSAFGAGASVFLVRPAAAAGALAFLLGSGAPAFMPDPAPLCPPGGAAMAVGMWGMPPTVPAGSPLAA